MLQEPETLGNIITAASGLHNYPVAIGLVFQQRLQDDACFHSKAVFTI